jgi:putative ABC transport system substrate-binding protein
MDRALRIIDADCAIIFAQVLDPVGAGLVTSLARPGARPGANVTGVSIMVEELSGKYLELLREVVPRLSRVAVLWEPDQPAGDSSPESASVSAGSRTCTCL